MLPGIEWASDPRLATPSPGSGRGGGTRTEEPELSAVYAPVYKLSNRVGSDERKGEGERELRDVKKPGVVRAMRRKRRNGQGLGRGGQRSCDRARAPSALTEEHLRKTVTPGAVTGAVTRQQRGRRGACARVSSSATDLKLRDDKPASDV